MFTGDTEGKLAARVFSGSPGHGVSLVSCGRVDMGAELDIVVRRERGFVVVKATGVIDISTVSRLRERLFEVADAGRPLIVDLQQITFIDSAGLGALIGAARRAEEHGGTLHAVCARPHTRKLLWLTGVDRRIPLSSSLDGAVASIAASGADRPATDPP